MIYKLRRLRILGSGVFLEGGAQLEIAHQSVEIVGVHAEESRSVGNASVGLVEGGDD